MDHSENKKSIIQARYSGALIVSMTKSWQVAIFGILTKDNIVLYLILLCTNSAHMIFKIFISYSQEDFKAHARRIHNYLSKIIPNSSVFIDQVKPKGEKWQEKNDAELVKSDLVVLLVTPAALQSTEVSREIRLAIENNTRILTCKPDDLEMSWTELPWNLGDLEGIEFEDDEILKIRLVRDIKKIIQISTPTPKTISSETASPHFDLIHIPFAKQQFQIKYGIEKGSLEIQAWEIDQDSCSFAIQTKTFVPTEFVVTLPRELIDAKVGHSDSEFFVLMNEEEIDFEETVTSTDRTLKFSCSKKTEQIEIIGNQICGISYDFPNEVEYEITILEGASNPNSGKSYDYPNLEIHKGESVMWKNQDLSAHTITSGTPDDGPDGLFDSGMLESKTLFPITFERTGVFTYFDLTNPWLVGTINVID